ncbi:ypfD [Symbiodinium natans]|uniref:YpfD protein n=1 Tax=Symbiodinium natans TaxID=878477 RepID=A0A812I453_9DINO|nr:ypfD [Symbiodinium natans]
MAPLAACRSARRTTRKPLAVLVALVACLYAPSFVLPAAPVARPLRHQQPSRGLALRARGGESDSAKLAVGDEVNALYPDDEQWYPGTIEKINDDGTYTVKWEDPEGGPESHDVAEENIKKIVIFSDYKVGEKVEAVFEEDGGWYTADVAKINDDGSFTVKWDDPDGGPEESTVQPKEMKYPPIPVEDLEIGAKYTGTVKTVLDFGAFVDIGAEADGLVHISRISTQRVENIYDEVHEGQEVEVWVSGKQDDGKFGLTMVEGRLDGGGRRAPEDLNPFFDILPSEWQKGVVARTAPFGAFVTVTLESGESADGLVHISKLQDGFVDNVEDVVQVGQEVKVRIEGVDLDAGKMSLSMREQGGFGGGMGGGRPPQNFEAFQVNGPM